MVGREGQSCRLVERAGWDNREIRIIGGNGRSVGLMVSSLVGWLVVVDQRDNPQSYDTQVVDYEDSIVTA